MYSPTTVQLCCNSWKGRQCIDHGGLYLAATFTVQSWLCQGVYFATTGVLGMLYGGKDLPGKAFRFLKNAMWVTFQVQFAGAVLTTFVVHFVLIPTMYKNLGSDNKAVMEGAQKGLKIMFSSQSIIMHTLNLVFMVADAVVNRLNFHTPHVYFTTLWGFWYASFAVVFHYYKGFWYYEFLDYDKPYAVVSYLVLLVCMTSFFFAGAKLEDWIHHLKFGASDPAESTRGRTRTRGASPGSRPESSAASGSPPTPRRQSTAKSSARKVSKSPAPKKTPKRTPRKTPSRRSSRGQ